jgi:hypothetical protein
VLLLRAVEEYVMRSNLEPLKELVEDRSVSSQQWQMLKNYVVMLIEFEDAKPIVTIEEMRPLKGLVVADDDSLIKVRCFCCTDEPP